MKIRYVAAGVVIVGLLLACSRTGPEVPDPSSTTGASATPTTSASTTPSPTAAPAGPCDALGNLEVSNTTYMFEPEWTREHMQLTDGHYDDGAYEIELLDLCAFGDISGDGVADAAGLINFIDLGYYMIGWKGTASGLKLAGIFYLHDAPATSITISGGIGKVTQGHNIFDSLPDTIQFQIGPGLHCINEWVTYCPLT